jgi:hypothetical protein
MIGLAVVLVATACSSDSGREAGDPGDWDGLSAYLTGQYGTPSTGVRPGEEIRRSSEDLWKCDVEGDDLLIAMSLDEGQTGEEAFSWSYFICGEDHTHQVMDNAQSWMSPVDITSAESGWAVWDRYATTSG